VKPVIDVLIAGRFLLKLLGASTQSAFVSFTYEVSLPFVAPFRGIFPNSGASTNVFEPASLVAIAFFALVGWGGLGDASASASPTRNYPPKRAVAAMAPPQPAR
jgi:hypothetical protein